MDNEDYVHVTSDTLLPPEDSDEELKEEDENSEPENTKDKSQEKNKKKLGKQIMRIIWIPILLAIASIAGLITVNVLYRKKYKTHKHKKEKKSDFYVPRV